MKIHLKRGLAVPAIAGLALAGCAAGTAGASTGANTLSAHHSQTMDLVIHLTNLEFVTVSGSSSPYPTGPLSPGDRVVGRDNVLEHGSLVGADYEFCTVGFGLHVLCDDMVEITNVGQMHIAWMFQWPSSGVPTSWDGVVDGGTGGYRNAIGSFHAQALPSGDDSITVQLEER